jgi:hypothetical protein
VGPRRWRRRAAGDLPCGALADPATQRPVFLVTATDPPRSRRRLLASGLAALLAVVAFAPTARARTAVSEIRGTILRVESAIVDDDPGACALMSRGVQRELLQSGRPLADLTQASCRRAVRRNHLTFAADHELGSARQILREQLATLGTSPVLFAFGRQRASVTVIGIEPEPEPTGSELQSTLTVGVVAVGRRWKVTSLDEQQQTLAEDIGAS